MSPKLFNVLLILTPIVLYYGYLSPMYEGGAGLIWTPESSISILKAQNVQYTNALNQVSLVETEIGKINKEYLAVDSKIKDKVGVLLPNSIDPIKLRNEITSIANSSGIAINGLTVITDPSVRSSELGAYKVSFSLTARYSVLKKLIENIERSMRLFVFDSIAIARVEKKEGSSVSSAVIDNEALSTTVSFKVYYLK